MRLAVMLWRAVMRRLRVMRGSVMSSCVVCRSVVSCWVRSRMRSVSGCVCQCGVMFTARHVEVLTRMNKARIVANHTGVLFI